jgi:ribonucleoside-diphosphate reductase beta chain
VFTVIQPLINSSSMLAASAEISKNEILHALTYSEIVKASFDDPDEVLKEVIANKEALNRLHTVHRVFEETARLSARVILGEVKREDPRVLRQVLLYFGTLLCLERIQFMASFAVTFSIERMGFFLPIANAVTKIANDEFNCHVLFDKEVIKNELKTLEGQKAFLEIKGQLREILHEVVECERQWTEHLFRDNTDLPGLTKESILDFMYYGGTMVANFLGLTQDFKTVSTNPLKFMEKKLDMNKEQASPQEDKTGNYLLGGFIDDGVDDLEVD